MNNITVIHFIYTLYGGVASVAANLINYQKKKGYKHLVVYVEYSEAFDDMTSSSCEKKQLKTPNLPGYSMLFGMRVKKIYYDYVKNHPNEFVIAHIHNIQALGTLGMWKNIPLVCTLHSLNGKEVSIRKKLSNILYKIALKRMIKYNKPITSVSKAIVEEYAKIKDAHKIQIIHNGTNIDLDKKRKFYNKEELVIGHVGNLSYAKGWDIIWDAYCKIHPDYQKKVKFISAGKELDFTKDVIEKMITDHSFQERVIYKGFINNAKDYFIPELDVLILVSRNEGLGLVQVEAMGYGIPVIGRDVGGICEILKDNYNGFVINTAEELANKIQNMLEDKDLYNKMSHNARETYLDRFTVDSMGLKYEKIYECIIDKYFSV